MTPEPMPTPRGDVARLPVWAREHIDTLTRRLDEHRAQIERLKTGRPGNTQVRDYVYGPTELGDEVAIRFLAVDRSPIILRDEGRAHLDAIMRRAGSGASNVGDVLEVSSSHCLSVWAWATNVVHIRWGPR